MTPDWRNDGPAPAGRAPVVLLALLVVVVLGQRLALPLPGPQVQLTLVAFLLATAMLLLQGRLQEDRPRLQLYALAVGACTLSSVLASWAGGPLSLPSWAVLLALYVPWVYRLSDLDPLGYRHLATCFVRLMVVLAVVGIGQMLAQVAGVWSYTDVLGRALPAAFLIEGYNTNIPIQWGASIHKSNAFVFLEPSFFSQYCGLALVIGLVLGVRVWQLVVLGLGLVVAVSGTGFFLLAVGLLLLLVRLPRAFRPTVVAPALAGLAVVPFTPVAALLLARRGEFAQSGSSGYSRFVAPYLEVAQGLALEPLRYLTGAGPGTATRLLESSARGQFGDAIVYNIPAKLVFEYGLVAGTLFTVFIAVALLHRAPAVVIPGTVLFMIFLLSGSLLQPHTIALAWLLTGVWAGTPRVTAQGQEPPRPSAHDGGPGHEAPVGAPGPA